MNVGEVRSLLADSSELEPALRAILEIDRNQETWTFSDIPVDSGVFGELVSEGIVESVDNKYRLADPDAVERALNGEDVSEKDASEGFSVDLSHPEIDRTAVGLLTLVLVVTAAVRAASYRSVFREHVVYPANDPYAYVYFVERGLLGGWSLSEIPAGRSNQEPLTTVKLLYSAEITGGMGSHQAILAWWPVLIAIATVVVLYLFAYEVSEDRRIALTSAFVLAILPVHVLRSSLGFVDHHAFDFFWLVVTAWGLVRTFEIETFTLDWETVSAIGLLGVGVAGGVLAWWAGTLLLFPIVVAVTLGGTLAVRDERSFYQPGLATAIGVGIGALVVLFAHVSWGWHDRVVVGVPIVLALGVVGVMAATALWHRLPIPAWTFPVTGVIGIVGTGGVVSRFAPEEWARISSQLTRLFANQEIAEVRSIFDGESMGWLFSFGLVFFVILPAMAWGLSRLYRGERKWLVASSYAWVLFLLAMVQARYAGEFAPFGAFFGGVALVYVAERVDAARPGVPFGGEDRALSIPDRSIAFRIAGVIILICGLTAVMAPIAAESISIPDEQYETAAFIDEHAEANGYEYPDSYVFSPWSWSRMYNYIVSGESRSYGYAQAHYRDFTVYENPDEAYERIQGGRADGAYLVTEPLPEDTEFPSTTMQSRLHNRLGSRGEEIDGLAHYRALYVSESGEYKAFRVVDGATIQGEADDDAVRVSTSVGIEGATFTYERAVESENGSFSVTVPYPGEYEIVGATSESVTIEEDAVINGARVSAEP